MLELATEQNLVQLLQLCGLAAVACMWPLWDDITIQHYRSVPGKRPWALNHTPLFFTYWALAWCTLRLQCVTIERGGVDYYGRGTC